MYVATTNCIGNVFHRIKFRKMTKQDIKKTWLFCFKASLTVGRTEVWRARIGTKRFNHNWLLLKRSLFVWKILWILELVITRLAQKLKTIWSGVGIKLDKFSNELYKPQPQKI